MSSKKGSFLNILHQGSVRKQVNNTVADAAMYPEVHQFVDDPMKQTI